MVSLVDLDKIGHAFASLHLDYCNALFSGLGKFSLMSLQAIKQGNCNKTINTFSSRAHITTILYSLNWLSVDSTICYEIFVFTYRALNGQAPDSLPYLLTKHTSARSLRSQAQNLLVVPNTKGQRFGAVSHNN